MRNSGTSRREILQKAGASGTLAAMQHLLPSWVMAQPGGRRPTPELSGSVIDLVIEESEFHAGGRKTRAMTINGSLPGPLLRLREGQEVTINVGNRLEEFTSIHWHGLLVPPEMDGVPGVSFAGIQPGTTFQYRFSLKQSGTYWYHSHYGGQEQAGVYAPMIVEPAEPEPFAFDSEHVVMLSDWGPASMNALISDLKKQSGYFNFQQRTLLEFISDVRRKGWRATWDNYLMWAKMRMDPTDLLDSTKHVFDFLMNGRTPEANWTALFRPGERVRLRFIEVGVMTFQDVRIPGLKMKVVQSDGQNVEPVEVDEFRIGPAETYDVIVEPKEDRAYTIFAETLDRSGYARGTLAPRPGMSAPIPERRPRPTRTMADMGMDMGSNGMKGMDMSTGGMHSRGVHGNGSQDETNMGPCKTNQQPMQGMDMGTDKSADQHGTMQGMDMGQQTTSGQPQKMPCSADMQAAQESAIPGSSPVKHSPDNHGIENQSIPEVTRSRLDDPGIGLENSDHKVLVYTDLRSVRRWEDQRPPEREIEIHLTGHMERYLWSFNGKKYSEARDPIPFYYGERLRWIFINDTMIEHTMHLHGMWMYLENGHGAYLPRKHTIIVKPAERVPVLITPEPLGRWAFHCHLLWHMEVGMFRVVEVRKRLAKAEL